MTDTNNTADVSGDTPRIENAPVPRDADKPKAKSAKAKSRKSKPKSKPATASKDETYIVGHDGKRVALDKYRESAEFVKGFDPTGGE